MVECEEHKMLEKSKRGRSIKKENGTSEKRQKVHFPERFKNATSLHHNGMFTKKIGYCKSGKLFKAILRQADLCKTNLYYKIYRNI